MGSVLHTDRRGGVIYSSVHSTVNGLLFSLKLKQFGLQRADICNDFIALASCGLGGFFGLKGPVLYEQLC